MLLPPEVIAKLVAVGGAEGPLTEAATETLRSLAGADYVNAAGPSEWNVVANQLKTSDLAALTRGLVVAEREHDWSGGSVGAAIWTFRALQTRDAVLAERTAAWHSSPS